MLALPSAVSNHTPAFLKFLVIGGISTILNYAVFFLLFHRFAIYYVLASAAGYVAGVVVGYLFNRHWTFAADKALHRQSREFMLYCTVYVISLLTSLLLLAALVDWLGLDARVANGLVIAVSTLINFIGLRFMVFKQRSHDVV